MTFSFLGAALWVGYDVTLAYIGSTVFPGGWWVGSLVAMALGLALVGVVKRRDSRKRSGSSSD